MIEYKHLTHIVSNKEFENTLLQGSPSDTHLNLCAILSGIGKHDIAYIHGLKALTFLQSEVYERIQRGDPLKTRCSILCIAYHNLGSELEFLDRMEDALATYKKGIKFAEKYLNSTDTLTVSLKKVFNHVQDKLNKEKEKRMKRSLEFSSKHIRTRSGNNRSKLASTRINTNTRRMMSNTKSLKVLIRTEQKVNIKK